MKKRMVLAAAFCALSVCCLAGCNSQGFNVVYSVDVAHKTLVSDVKYYYDEEGYNGLSEEEKSECVETEVQGETLYVKSSTGRCQGSKALAKGNIYIDKDKAIYYFGSASDTLSAAPFLDFLPHNTMRFKFSKKPVKSNGSISGNTVSYKSYGDKNVLYTAFSKTPLKAKKVTANIKNGAKTKRNTVYFKTKGIIKKITVNGENYYPYVAYKGGKVCKDCVKFPKQGEYRVKVYLVSGAKKTFKFRYKK